LNKNNNLNVPKEISQTQDITNKPVALELDRAGTSKKKATVIARCPKCGHEYYAK
jgi:ssDNA-binding Zn-finger/Zn-ribbon topoisomerase 1